MSKSENSILSRRIFKSYLSSIVSISLVLFLTGTAVLLLANAHAVADYFRENMRLSAMLNLETDESEAVRTAGAVSELRFVRTADIVSREQGTEEMKRLLGEDFLDVFSTNPIPISIDITLHGQFVNADSLDMVKKELARIPSIKEIVCQESLIDKLNANIERIGLILGVLIILLLFISTVLISNTVRLNVWSRRFTIRTMRLVGATKSFITAPFVGKAFLQGLLAGSIATLALLGALYAVRREFHQLYSLFDPRVLACVMAIVICAGIVICMAATSHTVRKLIKLTNDDIYF